MIGLDVILILAMAFVLFQLGQWIQKKTGILDIIVYLVLGVIFGAGGLALLNGNFYFFGNLNYFPSLSTYNTLLLYCMFMGAGFSINLKKDKNAPKKEKNTIAQRLTMIPVYVETLIVSTVMYGLFNMGVFTVSLNYIECLFFAAVFAGASPANIIPITMQKMAEGKVGNKNITSSVILASASDFVAPLPILLLTLIMILKEAVGMEQNTFLVIGLALIVLIVMGIAGVALGFVLTKLYNFLGKNALDQKKQTTVYTLAMYLTFALIVLGLKQFDAVNMAMGLFGIFFALFVGTGINSYEGNGLSGKVRQDLTKLFAVFGIPSVFTTVGAGISLLLFKDVMNIILILIIVAIAVAAKAFAAKYSIKNISGLDKGDIDYAMAATIPKGITLVNFSLVVGPMLVGYPSDLVPFMQSLAAIAILITIPWGVMTLNKVADTELHRISMDQE